MEPNFPERRFESLSLAEVCRRYDAALIAAPHQPSAHEEADVGYDVLYRIRHGHFVKAIFIQYKVSEFITQRRDPDCFGFHREPYFRFEPLRGRATPYYAQHNRLVALRQLGHSAHYCAPLFFLRDQLERNFGRRELLDQSFFGDPWVIGSIYSAETHHISYGAGGQRWAFHSELRDLGTGMTWNDVLEQAEPRDISESALDELAETIRSALDTASAEGLAGPPPEAERIDRDRELHPLREVSRLTKDYLGAALLLLAGPVDVARGRGRWGRG